MTKRARPVRSREARNYMYQEEVCASSGHDETTLSPAQKKKAAERRIRPFVPDAPVIDPQTHSAKEVEDAVRAVPENAEHVKLGNAVLGYTHKADKRSPWRVAT